MFAMPGLRGFFVSARQQDISEAELYINNPEVCERCTRLLERMLPSGATLKVILPDGTVKVFRGINR